MKHVLFVCTGNACRSQMAEGFARALGGAAFTAASAGLAPKGLDPRTVAAMAEVGLDVSGQTSDRLTPAHLEKADVVITLCGDARDSCPPLPPGVRYQHWPLEDPAGAEGDAEAVMARFRAVRDELAARVAALAAELRRQALAGTCRGKTILVGVSGGIAAYKAAALVSHLHQVGARVRVALTANAARFVGPLTFEGLTGRPLYTEFPVPGTGLAHLELAAEADAVLLAPATADLIGKLAAGLADDLLTTAVLAAGTRIPVLIAPAMNSAMWENPIVQRNVRLLREFGYRFVGPEHGALAEGCEGVGRLAAEEEILGALAAALQGN